MDMGIPPHQIKIMLESNPLKLTILVGRSGVLNGCEISVAKVTMQSVLSNHAEHDEHNIHQHGHDTNTYMCVALSCFVLNDGGKRNTTNKYKQTTNVDE